MDEELEKYKLQLQQVEAALLGDPQNEDMLKLKEDLKEIISLQVKYFEFAKKPKNRLKTLKRS